MPFCPNVAEAAACRQLQNQHVSKIPPPSSSQAPEPGLRAGPPDLSQRSAAGQESLREASPQGSSGATPTPSHRKEQPGVNGDTWDTDATQPGHRHHHYHCDTLRM